MKLAAAALMIFVCFAVLSSPAQIAPAPKKSTGGTKKDTAFKAMMSKLTDEFDYFGKTDTVPPKIDTSSFNLDKLIDEYILQDKKDGLQKNTGQKDKTLDWNLQNGNTDIWVTTASPLSNTDHYNGFVIKPRTAKILHLNITGSLFLKNTTYNPAYVPFYLQVKNVNTIFVNELESGKKTINIPLPSTDSVALYFIAHPNEKDTVDFHCDWSIGDTAAYSYAGQKPEAVFDKMLELAPNQFTNIHTDKLGGNADIEYPDGLFAPLPATRVAFYTHVTQYTAKKLATGQAADKINAEWNKKITAWLKDYNVTDIKKTESGDRSKNSDTEITTYTKYDAAGKFLFSVKVFKEQDGQGTEYEPIWWNTGVSIY
jgi:hypothetical protein